MNEGAPAASLAQDSPASVPTVEVGRPPRTNRLLFALGLVGVGAGSAQIATQLLNVPLKVAQIAPTSSTSALSVVLGIGTVIQLISYPLVGRASDRTLARIGRRRPWLVAGALLFAAGITTILLAQSVWMVAVGWTLNSLGYAAAVVPATALIADLYEPHERGLPSALVGIGPAVGSMLGLFLAQLNAPGSAAAFLLPAVPGIVAPLLLVLVAPDRPITAALRPALDRASLVATFWVSPRRQPRFALAWGSRFTIFLGVAAANMYQVFFLLGVLHVPGPQVARVVFLSQLIGNGLSLVVAPLVSRLSDRIGRRKPFVIGAALIFALGMVLITAAHDLSAFYVAFGVFGVGLGVYLAVDLALVTDILPSASEAAKDLGIMNLANSVPGSVIPVIAPVLLSIGAVAGGQNFAALFLFGAVAAAIGAALIVPIRGVR